MAFPAVQTADTKSGTVTSDSTSWTLTYPTNIAAGDLLIAICAIDESPSAGWPAGWVGGTGPGTGLIYFAKKIAVGTETGTFTLTLGTAQQGAWRIFRITGAGRWVVLDWAGFGSTATSAIANATSTTPDPPNLAPSDPDFVAWDNLWIAAFAGDASPTVSAYPLPDLQTADVSGGANGATLGICMANDAVTSKNPGTFTQSASVPWAAVTICITPLAARYVQATAGTTDAAGAWSYVTAGPQAVGNIWIVQLVQDGTQSGANMPDITSVTNAENIGGTDNVLTKIGFWDIGSAVAARQHLWIGRSLSASGMSITGANVGGDDVYVRVYEFTDVNAGSTLAEVIENSTAGSTTNGAATSATVADAAVTTLGANRLALNFIGINDDASGLGQLAGASGGTWVELATYETATGTDATIALQSCSMPSAGTIDGGTDTIVSLAWGVVGFALIPPATTAAATSLIYQPAPSSLYGR